MDHRRFFRVLSLLLIFALLAGAFALAEEDVSITIYDNQGNVVAGDGTPVPSEDGESEADAPVETPEPTRDPSLPVYEQDGSILLTLSFTGDVTIGTNVQASSSIFEKELKKQKGDITFPFRNVRDIFLADDMTMVNFEGTLTTAGKNPKKRDYSFLFRADPSYVAMLPAGGIDTVSFENNHADDMGEEGLKETKDTLLAAGIPYASEDEPAIMTVKGVKIGSVTRLSFDPARSDKVVLQFTIKRQYRIPTDSEAKIFSNGLMGAKAIEITYGTADTYLQKGDTLRSSRDRDLMDMAGSELDFFKQKVSQLTTDLSRTLENLNGLMETNADNIAGTLGNLNSVTGDMAEILSAEKNSLKSALDNLSKFSDMLGENAGRVDSIIGDVDRFTSQLTEEQFARKLSQAVEHLDDLVARIAQGEGTIGKLISDPELYDSLEKASDNLAALLADVKQYPGRYVHLSLFGRNPEKMKERADKKAAKAAAKAERDSLRRLQ